MNDYRRETPQGLGRIDPHLDAGAPRSTERKPSSSSTPAQDFEERALRIKRSYRAMPAVSLPSPNPPEQESATEEASLPAVVDSARVTSIRKISSTAVKTVVDLDPRFTPIRKAVDEILRPLSLNAPDDNGLKFYKVYIELCAANKWFARELAFWLNDRVVKIKKPGDEKPENYIIVNCAESDLDGMFPVVSLVKSSEKSKDGAKEDRIPLVNVLPDLQY